VSPLFFQFFSFFVTIFFEVKSAGTQSRVSRLAMIQRKKQFDAVEPRVINNDMLQEGVEAPVREDGELCELIDFPQVTRN
tara:strand:+ start:4154 stop:4393 length:240 start_codon:yes stop_codon:yes gene_type:complete